MDQSVLSSMPGLSHSSGYSFSSLTPAGILAWGPLSFLFLFSFSLVALAGRRGFTGPGESNRSCGEQGIGTAGLVSGGTWEKTVIWVSPKRVSHSHSEPPHPFSFPRSCQQLFCWDWGCLLFMDSEPSKCQNEANPEFGNIDMKTCYIFMQHIRTGLSFKPECFCKSVFPSQHFYPF